MSEKDYSLDVIKLNGIKDLVIETNKTTGQKTGKETSAMKIKRAPSLNRREILKVLKKIMTFPGGIVLVCPKCGQLYHNWFETDIDVWEDEESEMLVKKEFTAFKKLVIKKERVYRQFKILE